MADHTEWQKGDYTISTDPDRLDREVILDYLATSYWAHWVDREKVALSLEHCMPFGLYDGTGAQVGFAKVVTDYARFAWLGDVFILEAHRGHGLGVWLNETIKGHAPLVGINRWVLATRDAHGLYEKLGYEVLPNPEKWMVWDIREQAPQDD